MRFASHLLVFLLIEILFSTASAQSITGHSPVSRFGLGNRFGYGLVRNDGMAGIGLATPSQDHVNLINPAMLAYTEKVNFEIDIRYLYRTVTVGESYTYKNGGGGPAQISFSIPISKRLTTAFGIRPYTNRDFLYFQSKIIDTDTIQYSSRGSGGTSQAFFSAGYRINNYISLGLESSYIFGTLEDSLKFGTVPVSTNFIFISINKRRVSQVVFKPGIHIRYPIKEDNQTYLSFGATADLTRKYYYSNYQTFLVKGAGTAADILDNGSKGSIQKPATLSFGLGLYRSLAWSLNAEYDLLNGNSISSSESGIAYRDGYSFRLGGEFSPGTKKSTRYFNVITFRGGINLTQLPFTVDGKSMQNQSASFGASFPVIRKEAKFSRPLINFAATYGRTGTTNTSVGMEEYWQVTLGITLNDFLWFNRYRID